MTKVLKQAVRLLKDNGFDPSPSDKKLFTRHSGDQLHGVSILFTQSELRVRVQFHYSFLESFGRDGFDEPREPSIPLTEFRASDFVLQGEVAEFERPVLHKTSWTPWDDVRKAWGEWDSSFIESKTQFALTILMEAAEKWRDPRVIMDALSPESFECKVYWVGRDIPANQLWPIATRMLLPWRARPLQLCCLAASLAFLYGYSSVLVPKYEMIYRDMIAQYEASGTQRR